jgi:biopolymer transport protein ExbB
MSKYIALFLVLLSPFALADELDTAYQKEYAFLVAEKNAISQRLTGVIKKNKQTLAMLEQEISEAEKIFLDGQNQVDRLNQQIVEASRAGDSVENDVQLLKTTVLQAAESLKGMDKSLNETVSLDKQLAEAYALANQLIAADSQVGLSKGDYFDAAGNTISGEIMSVGRIAKFGLSKGHAGALYPSGHGRFSLWDGEAAVDATKLASGDIAKTNVFLFENASKGIEKREEKTFSDDLAAGGLVGKIILALGIAGLILVVVRSLFLLSFSSNVHAISDDMSSALRAKDKDKALSLFKKGKGSAHRVIAKTVQNLDKDRDHIEDIISEAILHEQSRIDRFGAVILVFAAVSPLLGLLGTVTGMISTFDIITEFGTGDPKLLSSGISEALITTKFGLVVAIPLLLMGNILSSWGSRIKNELEQVALNVINTYKA